MQTDDPIEKTRLTALRRRAMDYLARREHSRLELAQKLAKAFPDEKDEVITSILDQLVFDNLLSNYRFCESFFNSRVQRGYGPRMIRFELQQRGVEQVLVDRVFAEAGVDWQSVINRLARRRGLATIDAGLEEESEIDTADGVNSGVNSGVNKQSLSARDWQRHQRYFLSRGFSPEYINNLREQLDIHR